MADFSVVRQRLEITPAIARVFLLLANGWHICPTNISDYDVSPPDRNLSLLIILVVVVGDVNTSLIFNVIISLILKRFF